MRMSRIAGLVGMSVPTLKELFSGVTYSTGGSYNSGSAGNVTLSTSGLSGTLYYAFYTTGNGLEVSKIVRDAGTGYLTKTQLKQVGENRTIIVNGNDPTQLISSTAVYSGAINLFRFGNIPAAVIDKVFDGMTAAVKVGIYQSSFISTATGTRLQAADVVSDRLYMVAFRNNTTRYCSVSEGADILTPLYTNNGLVFLYHYQSGSLNYYNPSIDGTNSQPGYMRAYGVFEMA